MMTMMDDDKFDIFLYLYTMSCMYTHWWSCVPGMAVVSYLIYILYYFARRWVMINLSLI